MNSSHERKTLVLLSDKILIIMGRRTDAVTRSRADDDEAQSGMQIRPVSGRRELTRSSVDPRENGYVLSEGA